MKNLINQISAELQKELKPYQVSEITVIRGEVYTRSTYDIIPSLIEEIEAEALSIDDRNTVTIISELKRRTEKINEPNFRIICEQHFKSIGMTESEFNNNKSLICFVLANEICRIEDTLI